MIKYPTAGNISGNGIFQDFTGSLNSHFQNLIPGGGGISLIVKFLFNFYLIFILRIQITGYAVREDYDQYIKVYNTKIKTL